MEITIFVSANLHSGHDFFLNEFKKEGADRVSLIGGDLDAMGRMNGFVVLDAWSTRVASLAQLPAGLRSRIILGLDRFDHDSETPLALVEAVGLAGAVDSLWPHRLSTFYGLAPLVERIKGGPPRLEVNTSHDSVRCTVERGGVASVLVRYCREYEKTILGKSSD